MANSKNFSSWPRLVISTTSIWTKTGLDRLWGARTVAQAHHLARGGSYTLQCCGVSLSHEQWENQEFYMEAALQKWTDAWGILLTGLCCWGLSSVLPLTKNKRPHSGKWIPTDFSTPRGVVTSFWSPKNACEWKISILIRKEPLKSHPKLKKFTKKPSLLEIFLLQPFCRKLLPPIWPRLECTCGSSPSALLLDQQSSTWCFRGNQNQQLHFTTLLGL